jgi:hypothetical protein
MPDLTVREGELVIVSPIGHDRELVGGRYAGDEHAGAALAYEVTGLPAGATFQPTRDGEEPQLWWVPGFDQAGSYTLEIIAKDTAGARSPARSVRITVLDAPAIDTVRPAPSATVPAPTSTPAPVLLPYAVWPDPDTPTPTPEPQTSTPPPTGEPPGPGTPGPETPSPTGTGLPRRPATARSG